MAKPMIIPTDDIVLQYRIKALSTPPEAFEMTSADRDVVTVLNRRDLTPAEKIKQFNAVISKYMLVRKNFTENSTPQNLLPAPPPSPPPPIQVTNNREGEFAATVAADESYNTVNNEDGFLSAEELQHLSETKNEKPLSHSTPFSKRTAEKILSPEEAKQILTSQSGLRIDSDGSVYVNSKRIGTDEHVDKILQYLLSRSGNVKSPRFIDVGVGQNTGQLVRNRGMNTELTRLLKDYIPENRLALFPKLKSSAVKKLSGKGRGKGSLIHAKRASNHRAGGGGGGGSGVYINFDRWESII
jgi:hypothetical protein